MVIFGSYINRHSNEDSGCVPAGFSEDTGNPLYEGVKTVGACNNDILVSVSDDAGASFSGGDTDVRDLPSATSARRQRTTDQWFQWAAFTRDGKLATSYYDRQHGDDELTDWSDTRTPAPVLCPGTGTPGHPPRLCVTPAPNAPYNNDQEIHTAAVRVPSG